MTKSRLKSKQPRSKPGKSKKSYAAPCCPKAECCFIQDGHATCASFQAEGRNDRGDGPCGGMAAHSVRAFLAGQVCKKLGLKPFL